MPKLKPLTVKEIANMKPVDLITYIPELSFNRFLELVDTLLESGYADCERCTFRKKPTGNVIGDIFCGAGLMKMNNPINILTKKKCECFEDKRKTIRPSRQISDDPLKLKSLSDNHPGR